MKQTTLYHLDGSVQGNLLTGHQRDDDPGNRQSFSKALDLNPCILWRRYAEVIVKTKDWPFIGSHGSICVTEGKEEKKLCHLYQLTTFKKITTAFSHMLVRTYINLRWAQNSYPQGRSLYGHEQDGGTKMESVLSIFLQCHNICLWKWAGIKFRKAGAIRTWDYCPSALLVLHHILAFPCRNNQPAHSSRHPSKAAPAP